MLVFSIGRQPTTRICLTGSILSVMNSLGSALMVMVKWKKLDWSMTILINLFILSFCFIITNVVKEKCNLIIALENSVT